jgi:hypothetical protein
MSRPLHAQIVEVRPLAEVFDDGMPPLPRALECLTELGFELTGMFPVTRDRDLLGVVELDCVLRRAGGEVPAA